MNYHPSKSNLSKEVLSEFLRSPLSINIEDIPGISEVSAQRFRDFNVLTSYQLIGAYLRLKENIDIVEHQDRFYIWLYSINIPISSRSNIIRAIALKVNDMIPGIYDESYYN